MVAAVGVCIAADSGGSALQPLPVFQSKSLAKATIESGPSILTVQTYYSYDGYVFNYDYSGDADDIDYASGYESGDTWGYAEVDANGDGGWAWVRHGFYIQDDDLGGFSHIKYRYYITYDDTASGQRAWAYCRVYLYIFKWTGTSWQYVGGTSTVYDSDFNNYGEIETDFNFESNTTYLFQMFAHNYAKAYDGAYARSESDPHVFVYLRLTG